MMKKIKVGGITYKVKFKELVCYEGVLLGLCNKSKALITVNNHNVDEQVQKQTLIHEITHAIIDEAGLEFGDDDETITNQFALVLYQVLKDNDFSWVK